MPKQIGQTKLYTVDEVSRMLELTAVTVRVYIRAGKIKARKIGTRYHVTEKDLEKYATAGAR